MMDVYWPIREFVICALLSVSHGCSGNCFVKVGGDIWINCTLSSTSYINYIKLPDTVPMCSAFVESKSDQDVVLPSRLHLLRFDVLRMMSITWGDAGVYQCVTTQKEETFRYSVMGPVELMNATASIAVIESDTSRLLCSVVVRLADESVKQALHLDWIVGGLTHTGSLGLMNTQDNSWNLSSSVDLQFLRGDDWKSVKCRLSFGNQVLQEVISKVDVQYPPDGVTVTTKTLSTIFREGESANLFCHYVSANPFVSSFTWVKDDMALDSRGSELTIGRVQKKDAGTYRCKAANTVGFGTAALDLLVKYLHVSVKASITPIREGSRLSLHCDVDGIPKTYNFGIWTHIDLYGVKHSLQQTHGRRQIVVENIGYTQAGQYCCSCSNREFNTTTCTPVKVTFSPKEDTFNKRKVEVGSASGSNASLALHVVANPTNCKFEWFIGWPPHISPMPQWKYRSNETSTLLTLNEVTSEDYGNYTCQATNPVGVSQFTFQLKAPGPADAPKNLTVTKRTAVSFVLSWVSAFDGGHTQVFDVSYKPSNSQSYLSIWSVPDPGQRLSVTVKVDNLKPAMSYDLQVRSRNYLSTENDGQSVVVKAYTKVRPSTPENITVIVGDKVASLSWKRIEDNITGIGIKYCPAMSPCSIQMVAPDVNSVEIPLNKNYRYTFQLLLFDGSDVVQISDTYNEQTGNADQPADVAGVVVGVLIALLIALIVVLIIVKRRTKLREEEIGCDSESFGSVHIPCDDGEPSGMHHLLEQSVEEISIIKDKDETEDVGRESCLLPRHPRSPPPSKIQRSCVNTNNKEESESKDQRADSPEYASIDCDSKKKHRPGDNLSVL